MTSNKLPYVLALCLLVILFLFILSFIPEFKIGKAKFKSIDLLSDIKDEPVDSLAMLDSLITDSVQAKIDSVKEAVQSSCRKGITCIEDYSSDSTAMRQFIKALKLVRSKTKPLHIAMFGDSFIEGDVMCGSLRDTLQNIFGGSGVGYVPITSEVAGFRTNIKHKFENWRTLSLMMKRDTTDSTTRVDLGPAGFCFIPRPDNWVEYKPTKHKEFTGIKFYYKNRGNSTFDLTLNDTIVSSHSLKQSASLQQWSYHGEHIKAVKFQFPANDSLQLYGTIFENSSGIYIDNFSMRGNSGIPLPRIPDGMHKSFNQYRDYKLIILQYGLNVVQEDSLHYGWYAARMIRVVNKLKQDYPNASFLLIGVSDRSTNTTGNFKTMKAIPALRNAQRLIAQRTGIAFWDLYEAMGGENSMIKFVEGKPSLAAKDYTHLTFKGGRKLASLLAKSLLYEEEKYGRRKKKK